MNGQQVIILILMVQSSELLKHKPVLKVAFGPYYLITTWAANCSSFADLQVIFKAYKVTRIHEDYRINVTVNSDIRLTDVSGDIKSNGGFQPEFRKHIENPCGNPNVSESMKKHFNADSDCIVKKGRYEINDMGPNYVMHKSFPEFYYTTLALTLEFKSDDRVVYCERLTVDVKPLRFTL